MKVISFNIRSASDPNGHSFNERAPRLKAVIEKYDPDLIGFQEVVPAWMEHIPEDYGEKYEIFHKFRCEEFDVEGCTILWKKDKFECLDKGYFWFSETPGIVSRGWDSIGCHRTCMWVKLKDLEKGTVFHFFDTHFGFSDQCQLDSVKLLLDHYKALKVKSALLTGDFNMYNHSPAYKELTKKLANLNELLDNDLSPTFHGYDPEKYPYTPIDFCFVTPDTVEPLSYKRLDDTFDGKYPSDHYGLLLEMEMKQNAEIMSMNVCESLPEEEEAKTRGRMNTAKLHIARHQQPDLCGLQEVPAWMEESFAKTKYYGYAPLGSKNPVLWHTPDYELVDASVLPLPGKEECSIVTVKHLTTGKELCLFNAHIVENEEESVRLILEKIAECTLPVVLLGSLNLQIGSPAYRLLREQLTDVRWAKAPDNIQPTRHGKGQDMVAPAIVDYVFCKGMTPVRYELVPIKDRFAKVTDHDAIVADVAF